MPRPPPSTTDARSQRIIQAGKDLFTSKGFHATTTDEIAQAAQLSKATLYARYPTKEQLLFDVLHSVLTQLVIPPAPATNRRDQLVFIAENLLATLMHPDYLALVRMLIAELPRQPLLGPLFAQAIPVQVLSQVGVALRDLCSERQFDAAATELAARTFVGPLLTFVLLDGLLSNAPQRPTRPVVEALVDHALYGILGRHP